MQNTAKHIVDMIQDGTNVVVSHGNGPVSYTHLDVYKRQTKRCAPTRAFCSTRHSSWRAFCPTTRSPSPRLSLS